MPMNKDYRLSLNKGLFNTFHTKYYREAMDQIIEDVNNAESLPKGEKNLARFAKKLVEEAINEDFKDLLTAQVIRSIRDAPPNRDIYGNA